MNSMYEYVYDTLKRKCVGNDCPYNSRGVLEGTVTGVPANAFTISINSTNRNTLLKADFS